MKVLILLLIAGAGVVAAKTVKLETVINTIAEAIKTFEGWYRGSRSFRNNNPGNLKFAGQPGAIGQDETGHAVFDSYANGWAALTRQIRVAFTGKSKVYSPEDSLLIFFTKYAEANSLQYAQFVAGKLHATITTKLKDLLT